jgi:glycosyltransferase involved in cell wall biosynthesis
MKSNIIIILTAYNEENNLSALLSIIPEQFDVLIVDDGSRDNTQEVALNYGCQVVRHPINLGQGAAAVTGYRMAVLEGYDLIVKMDADGQHNPEEILYFIEKLENTQCDIVIGSRRLGSNYDTAPFFRKTFLPLYTFIINKLTGYNMTDAMSGFRAFRTSSFKNIVRIFDDMIEPQYLASEMFVRFAKAGLTVEEIPINMRERMTGSSHKGFIRYGWGVLKAIIRTFIDKNYYRNTF